ncbi:dihydrouridine synthase DuS [Desulfovibrio sp. X2]|uniref:tRNA dihydrouridine synthase n=1 Tax=Desulfovibrio sp. X2 TaxID=941449 RepID=UPI000358C1D2|nr:tRNA-dihydrouridine synthase family protein [Desulfovibrio sp. X2]EPR42431.1 dihydrouridine synthase DuS [Desulfovibrio sp. X2]
MPDTTTVLPPIAPDRPWLAPLAGYSDLPFRLLCREHGAACCETEMVSAKGLLFTSKGTARLLATTPEDAPLVVQLFGADPDIVARGAAFVLERGHALLDLNAGCPVPKVVKTGCGAAMMREPERLAAVAEAMVREAGEGRVGVKIRLGWTHDEQTFLEAAKRLEDVGVAWLTLHPRSGAQGYSGEAHWPSLGAVKAAVNVPVIASGDLFTAEDAARCIAQTGVDGVMFARGALRHPGIFEDLRELLAGRAPAPLTGTRIASFIRRHAALIRDHGAPRKDLLKLRTVIPRFVHGLPGSKEIRKRMILCHSWDMVHELAEMLEALDTAQDSPEDVSPAPAVALSAEVAPGSEAT